MIKRFLLLVVTAAFCSVGFVSVAAAAKPAGHGGGTSGGTKTNTLGYDVSYPQCGATLPTDGAFAVVGVNGTNAAQHNTCLAEQFAWAQQSSGVVTAQDKAQLYVNTANPGQVIDQMTSPWPSDNSNSGSYGNPYGTCTGTATNDAACSYEYGWGRAQFALDYFVATTGQPAANYKWWLDVETGNTWESGSTDAYANNVADLEGEVAAFTANGVSRVGLYSTAAQWSQITNGQLGYGTLNGLDNWRPGGASLRTAKQACTADPLTPNGQVVLTQFQAKGLDTDYSCI